MRRQDEDQEMEHVGLSCSSESPGLVTYWKEKIDNLGSCVGMEPLVVQQLRLCALNAGAGFFLVELDPPRCNSRSSMLQ